MTGPSAVTVSLMDGAWKEVKRLPLGPSLSDAWWRFGGLIEVKVSSNRTKFPAVITKKIKGMAMWYEGTSKASLAQPQYETEEESDAFSIRRKIGVFVLGSRLSQDRWDSPTAHCVPEHLRVFPTAQTPGKVKTSLCSHSGALHSIPVAVAEGGLRHSTTPMQKNLWNSRFKCPCSFYHLETRVLAISFFLLPPRLLLCG